MPTCDVFNYVNCLVPKLGQFVSVCFYLCLQTWCDLHCFYYYICKKLTSLQLCVRTM